MMPTIAGPSWTAGRLFGIPILVHWTLALMLGAIVLQSLWQVAFPYSLSSIAVALLIAGSILFHELAHAMIARRRGYRTSRIELHAFGGLAWVDGADMRDRDQIAVSAAGPFSNLLLWLVFEALAQGAGRFTYTGSCLHHVADFNFKIGLFNMLPAYPLDGGSVFLSWLRLRAPHSQAGWLAFTLGQGIGALMALFGLLTNEIVLTLVGFVVYQACAQRLMSVGAVGGWLYWKSRITFPSFRGGRQPGKLEIDWSKYSPPRAPTLLERIKGFFSRGSSQRPTPPRTPTILHPDEPDDQPPTIN